ncbi:hypothetical protein N8I71_00230 [Roseibacterium sp. SDUM158016]|uniref:hypothetical protein n=1 Tax=Roseicyclus sediminis TaxID=2980997 RepID=UPI0021D21C6C|nr:hypothetical protein [Roseibacterium sp. SDUM158016]MCU4651240.1 hypothetical protein [Roseibacterium sp. SDUM158016]
MTGNSSAASDRTRSGIHLEERDGQVTLTVYARNRLVSWIVSLLAVFPAMGALFLAVNGLRVSDYLTVLVMVSVTLGILWLAWRIGWRRRAFRIVFKPDHLEAGPHRIAYSDIQSCGISRDGGDPYDPASMGIPRNYTAGPHVFVQVGERRMPVTVGLRDDQARSALGAVEHYLDRFGAR